MPFYSAARMQLLLMGLKEGVLALCSLFFIESVDV